MKRVTQKEFLEYPAGALYAFVADPLAPPRHGYNLLCQKGETVGQGSFYRILSPVLDINLQYCLDQAEHPSGDGGYYDQTPRFIIYERAEVRELLCAVELAWSLA